MSIIRVVRQDPTPERPYEWRVDFAERNGPDDYEGPVIYASKFEVTDERKVSKDGCLSV